MDELDWEDIESRLYSQVYHASVEKEQLTTPFCSNTITDTDTSLNKPYAVRSVMKHSRYFNTQNNSSNRPVYIPLENEQEQTTAENVHNSVESNVTLKSNPTGLSSEGSIVSQFQNNITVNQYTIPVIINSELQAGDGKLFTSWPLKGQNDKKPRKRNRKRGKQKEAKQTDKRDMYSSLTVEVNFNDNLQSLNEIICISDDSSSECMLEKMEVNTGFPKKYVEGEKGSKKPESDDDIIYIPPPPIEVINVDIEEVGDIQGPETEEQEHQNVGEELYSHKSISSTKLPAKESRKVLGTQESSGSYDFLESTTIEGNTDKFNFGLHGSEFNSSQGDFVRPANPVDFCETESSSCSTNDCNRDVSNSVKTVVFDEVEFPREDIFSEKNLESFGTYITPKRNTTPKSKTSAANSGTSTPKNVVNTSSDSSSESDYEQSENLAVGVELGKRLPNLSPMSFGDTTTPKKKSTKIKTASNFFQNQTARKGSLQTETESSKRKSDVIEVSETDSSDTDDVDKKRQPKKKQKMSKSLEEKKKKGATPLEKQKKKKEKQLAEKPDLDSNISPIKDVGGNTGNESVSIISQWTKSKNSSEFKRTKNEESAATISDVREKKKNRNYSESTSSNNESISDKSERKKKKNSSGSKAVSSESNIPEVVSEVTSKKKKKNSVSETTQTSKPAEINITEKLKKKKTVSSENSENEDILTEKHQKKRKSSCSTSSNRSQDRQELSEVEDEIIDVVTVDHTDQEIDKSCNKSDDLPSNENLTHSQPVEVSSKEQNKDETSDEIDVVNTSEEIPNSETISPPNDTKTSTIEETKSDNSDEEIVVDDEPDFTMSSLIVVDEVNATENSEIQILLSSDSECDFLELGDVGKDLQLANCTTKVNKAKVSQAPVTVDGTRGGSHNASKKDYSDFDVEAIQRGQSDDPEMWKISFEDRDPGLNVGQFKARRCNRCRHFGHIALKCTEKIEGPKCSLCGNPGHLEPRCPNKICRRCGNKGDFSTFCWQCFKFRNTLCKTCNMVGHVAEACPDLWRRYHLTTKEGPIVVSGTPQLKPRHQRWCSGCARQGHLEYECTYIYREYPPTSPCIFRYEDVLLVGNSVEGAQWSNVSTCETAVNDIQCHEKQTKDGDDETAGPEDLCLEEDSLHSSSCSSDVILLSPQRDESQNKSSSKNVCPLISLVSSESSEESDSGENEIMTVSSSPPASEQQKLDCSSVDGPTSTHVGKDSVIQENPGLQNAILIRRIIRRDRYKVRRILFEKPDNFARNFLKKEMAEMQSLRSTVDPIVLRRQLKKCKAFNDGKELVTEEAIREKCYLFRILNMFIFGLHECLAGRKHKRVLNNFIQQKQDKVPTRKSLFFSHSYIFGTDEHPRVRYSHLLNSIVKNTNCRRSSGPIARDKVKTEPEGVNLTDISHSNNCSSAVMACSQRDAYGVPHFLNSNNGTKFDSKNLGPVQESLSNIQNIVSSDSQRPSSCTQTAHISNDNVQNALTPLESSECSQPPVSVEDEIVTISSLSPPVEQRRPYGALVDKIDSDELSPLGETSANLRADLRDAITIKRLFKKEHNKIKHVILGKPDRYVREFLDKEMAELLSLGDKIDPVFLKQQLLRYSSSNGNELMTEEALREQCYWFRILNMFILGFHECHVGSMHKKILKNFIRQKRSRQPRRESVLFSYNYIFGIDRHPRIRYGHYLNKIIKKSMSNPWIENISSKTFPVVVCSSDLAGSSESQVSQRPLASVVSVEDEIVSISSSPPPVDQQDLEQNSLDKNRPTRIGESPSSRFYDAQNSLHPNLRINKPSQTVGRYKSKLRLKTRKVITEKPYALVCQFLEKELAVLQSLNGKYDPVFLKEQFMRYVDEKGTQCATQEELMDRWFWLRTLNMFIFGLHECSAGKEHMSVLRSFLDQERDSRDRVFRSYLYIFDPVRHADMDYCGLLDGIIKSVGDSRSKSRASNTYKLGSNAEDDAISILSVSSRATPSNNVALSGQEVLPASENAALTLQRKFSEENILCGNMPDSPSRTVHFTENVEPTELQIINGSSQPLEDTALETVPSNLCSTVEEQRPEHDLVDQRSSDQIDAPYEDLQSQNVPATVDSAVPTSVIIKQISMKEQVAVKRIIMHSCDNFVLDFLKGNMAELQSLKSKIDPIILRQQLMEEYQKHDEVATEETLHEKCNWFRTLNMFVFGLHERGDGGKHMQVLRKFLAQKKNEVPIRNALLTSYSYIFGMDMQRCVSYHRLLNDIIAQTNRCKSSNNVKEGPSLPPDISKKNPSIGNKIVSSQKVQSSESAYQKIASDKIPSQNKVALEGTACCDVIDASQTVVVSSSVSFEQQKPEPSLVDPASLSQIEENVSHDEKYLRIDNVSEKVSSARRTALLTTKVTRSNRLKIEGIIFKKSVNVVCNFLKKEIAEMKSLDRKIDPRVLRQKFTSYRSCSKSQGEVTKEVLQEKCRWFKTVNMFIFGLHERCDGAKHMEVLRKFINQKQYNVPSRNSVLNSYTYIFGANERRRANYYSLLDEIIEKMAECQGGNTLKEVSLPVDKSEEKSCLGDDIIVTEKGKSQAQNAPFFFALGSSESVYEKESCQRNVHQSLQSQSNSQNEVPSAEVSCKNLSDSRLQNIHGFESTVCSVEVSQTPQSQTGLLSSQSLNKSLMAPPEQQNPEYSSVDTTQTGESLVSNDKEYLSIDSASKDVKSDLPVYIRSKRLIKRDYFKIKQMLLKKPANVVSEFLQSEIAELQLLGTKIDPIFLRQQLTRYFRQNRGKEPVTEEGLREKCHWFKTLNMFIFGLHERCDGVRHMQVLRDFIRQKEDEVPSRKSLLISHGYIFQGNKHPRVNYYSLMTEIIENTIKYQRAKNLEEVSSLPLNVTDGNPVLGEGTISVQKDKSEPQSAPFFFAFGSSKDVYEKVSSPQNVQSPQSLQNQTSSQSGSQNELPSEEASCNTPHSQIEQQNLEDNSVDVVDTTPNLVPNDERCPPIASEGEESAPPVSESIKELMKKDVWKSKQIILKKPASFVSEFLQNEIAELQLLDTKIVPIFLRQQLTTYYENNRGKKANLWGKCSWFKILNMLIFGLHEQCDGKKHMRVLRHFIKEKEEAVVSRIMLLKSYSYVFGSGRHRRVSYFSEINKIIKEMGEKSGDVACLSNVLETNSRLSDDREGESSRVVCSPQGFQNQVVLQVDSQKIRSEEPSCSKYLQNTHLLNEDSISSVESKVLVSQSVEYSSSCKSETPIASKAFLPFEQQEEECSLTDQLRLIKIDEDLVPPDKEDHGFSYIWRMSNPAKHQDESKDLIMTKPYNSVCEFLQKEMAEIQSLALMNKSDVKFLMEQFRKCNIIRKSRTLVLKDIRYLHYWSRILNMFIFGAHERGVGKEHMDVLRNFLAEEENDQSGRNRVLLAYNYVFGTVRHPFIMYYEILREIIANAEDCKRASYLPGLLDAPASQNISLPTTESSHNPLCLQNVPPAQASSSSQGTLITGGFSESHSQGEIDVLQPKTTPVLKSFESTEQSVSVKDKIVPAPNPCRIEDVVILYLDPSVRIPKKIVPLLMTFERSIKRAILQQPVATVCEFLKKEMAELQALDGKFDAKFLKQQLMKYYKSKKTECRTEEALREKSYWFRVFNMFIFGLHECEDGKMHMRVLRNFLAQNGNDVPSRTKVVQSNAYIFGFDKHSSVSYYNLINTIIRKLKVNKRKN